MAPIESLPCTLRQLLVKKDPWHNDRVVDVYQRIIRSIIKFIVRQELKGITRGYLGVDDIQIDENYEANIPTITNLNARSYWQEFVYLMEAILGKDQKRTVELSHFFNMIHCEREWYRFEQLIYHPLLRSPLERFHYYIDGLLHLQYFENSEIKKVKELFTLRWNEKVDIKGVSGELEGFMGVLSEREYEENVWGALEYSSNACLKVNDHLVHQERLTQEQVEEKLSLFFPKLLLQLYTFLIEMYTHADLREQTKEEEKEKEGMKNEDRKDSREQIIN